MLLRSDVNPILSPDSGVAWRARKVYNPAVIKQGPLYKMFFRAVGEDWVSRIGSATSADGVKFQVADFPALQPKRPWEKMGCEDPRLTQIDKKYLLTYTAFDGVTARAAATTSRGLKRWGRRTLLLPGWQDNPRSDVTADWSKGAAIFPQIFGSKYYLLFGDSQIWAAASADLKRWQALPEPLLSRRPGYFDEGYVETGPPPILTERGWLVLYHGIDKTDATRTYYLGAALFDVNDPLKLIWRSSQPVMEPSEPYERAGLLDVIDGGFETLRGLSMIDMEALAHQHRLPRAVFCCGAILEGDEIRLYYGAGDTVICTASIDLDSLFKL